MQIAQGRCAIFFSILWYEEVVIVSGVRQSGKAKPAKKGVQQ